MEQLGASQNHLLPILWAWVGVARNGCSPLMNCRFVYLEEASYVKAQIIHTVGPVTQLHVSVADDLFCCKVRTQHINGITELPPLRLATYEDSPFRPDKMLAL